MQNSDRGLSWRVAEGEPTALLHALYARDASGLDVEMDSPIPPLSPIVEIDERFTVHATPRAAADWPRWWLSETDLGLAPAPDDPDLWFAGRSVDPDLRALLTETAAPMLLWHRERKREHIDSVVNRTPSQGMLVNRLVDEVEHDLGHRAAAFDLKIDILPVQGAWGCRTRVDHVLASRELRGDDAAFRDFLGPVIRSLA